MLAVRTPGAPLATRTLSRPAIPPSPLRDSVGYSDHDRFRGYFPVHFIPAYHLPVYASQWPLPDTTQDSVRGCSLGSTAAAISGDRVQRTCTAQPPSLRVAVARDQHDRHSEEVSRNGEVDPVLHPDPPGSRGNHTIDHNG